VTQAFVLTQMFKTYKQSVMRWNICLPGWTN